MPGSLPIYFFFLVALAGCFINCYALMSIFFPGVQKFIYFRIGLVAILALASSVFIIPWLVIFPERERWLLFGGIAGIGLAAIELRKKIIDRKENDFFSRKELLFIFLRFTLYATICMSVAWMVYKP